MTRRLGLALLAALAVLLASAAPAAAARDLPVTVDEVKPDQVRLVADLPGVSAAGIPPVTVARDGWLLSSSVAVEEAGAARTVLVVLDNGAAMAGAPLRAAQAGVLAYAERVPADVAIGLVAAAGEPTVLVRPTRDRGELRAALADLRATGDTALYAGLRAAAGLVTDEAEARLLVLAGGLDSKDPAPALRELLAAGVRVDLVGIPGGRAVPAELRQLVTATGGTVRSAGPDGVSAVLRAAADTVPLRVAITVSVPPELAGTTSTLTVTAGTGAAAARGTAPVRFAASASANSSGSSAAADDRALPSLPALRVDLVAVLVFGVLLVSTLLVAFSLNGSVRQRRLRQVEQFRPATAGARAAQSGQPPGPTGGFVRTTLGVSGRLRGARSGADTAHGGPGSEPRARSSDPAVRVGAPLAGAVLLGLLGGVLGVLLGAALGWLGPRLHRRLRESRRRRAFADQLPDALQLIVGSLRSGFSLAQAIDAVVQDSPPGPLTAELGRAMAEIRLGSDLDEALERVAQRVENDDLAWAVMAIRIQRDTGGNLAEVLETTVETLRERDRLRRHVRALSAEGRLSAYVLIALPVVMAIWMLLTRREYLSPLWTTPVGLLMLVGAVVLMVVGIFWMARWIKVEV
ncbi:type II secretion system F family protein [Micromonospora kangleipakensis]|uniref:type II secretion system F family protein n=1 Tax=Micromonospora kangleipakensis TaxID=1077942 RepID=UPI001029FCF9|nr:type II secretion system F family protein [Micromonospora kangleipakensis]